MIDIQSGLGLKHIPQLIRRKMCGCYNCKYAIGLLCIVKTMKLFTLTVLM